MLLTKVSFPTTNIPTAAYIHIPFCRRRCFYCDFPIAVLGDRRRGEASGTIRQYLAYLCQEIRQTPAWGSPLQTIFFGGGTPSLLSPTQLQQILTTLDQQFGISADAEISMEIDPATFDLAQVQGYRAVGVNRVSLGAQAFQAELLTRAGRSHQVEDIQQAVTTLRQAGFINISLDLIAGLPGQSLDDWHASLVQAINLAPTHLSCYDLTIEAGTPFSRQYKPGEAPLPSDEMTAEMYRLAHQLLTEAGYDHYEISNYAKPGYACQHNQVYWKNQPFYGFGMGATSYLARNRIARPRQTQAYYRWVDAKQQVEVEQLAQQDAITFDTTTDLLDSLMLGLRLKQGIHLAELGDRFGVTTVEQIWRCLQPYQQQGWVVLENAENFPLSGTIRLTQPEGFLFSNVLLVRLFEVFETEQILP